MKEVKECFESVIIQYKKQQKDKNGKVIEDKSRSPLDVFIENSIGKVFSFTFMFIFTIFKNLLLLVPHGIAQCRFRHNKTDIIIIIVALITLPLTAIYLSTSIIVISVSYILTAISLRGLVFSYEKYKFDCDMKSCQIMSNNHKYPRLKAIRYEGMSKIFVLNSSVPSSKFIMQVSKLSNSLNTNITQISLVNKSLLVYTNKDQKINEEYLQIEKFRNVFEKMELDVIIRDYEDTEYYTNIFFNSELFKSKLVSLLPELEHRLKVSNLELLTDQKFDYKLSMKKTILEVKTFLANWDLHKNITDKMHMPCMIGVSCDSGKVTILDLSKDIVHGIVAGSSGGGKSVELHNICSSLVLADRKYIKLVLCDPKKNELKTYRSLERVVYANSDEGIVKEVENCVKEMDKRNDLFEPYDTICDITDWNNNFPERSLDYIVLVIDEIADFMAKSNDDISKRFKVAVERLLQLGRSTGFILFLTTQNPIKEVITSLMKANMETRFGFATTDKRKSITILDNPMCFALSEKGKFVFQNKKKNVIHKSFFISENEKIEVINRLKLCKENSHESDKPIIVSLEKTNVDESMRENNPTMMSMSPQTYQDLYNFYINLQQKDNKLPTRKERERLAGLTEWKLRKLEDELRKQKMIYNVGLDLLVNVDLDVVHKLVANETNIIDFSKRK